MGQTKYSKNPSAQVNTSNWKQMSPEQAKDFHPSNMDFVREERKPTKDFIYAQVIYPQLEYEGEPVLVNLYWVQRDRILVQGGYPITERMAQNYREM